MDQEGIKEIRVYTMEKALSEMKVGESRYASVELSDGFVRKACSEMKSKGYEFVTRVVNGRRLITRVV